MRTRRQQGRMQPFAPPRVDCGPQTKDFALDVVRILAAIILPPLGVFLQVGIGLHFWLNILLTIFGYVPGIIHAIWVVLRK